MWSPHSWFQLLTTLLNRTPFTSPRFYSLSIIQFNCSHNRQNHIQFPQLASRLSFLLLQWRYRKCHSLLIRSSEWERPPAAQCTARCPVSISCKVDRLITKTDSVQQHCLWSWINRSQVQFLICPEPVSLFPLTHSEYTGHIFDKNWSMSLRTRARSSVAIPST